MDVQIKTKDVRLTESLDQYIQKRLAKLDRVNERVIDAKLEIRPEHNRTGGKMIVVQFTIATTNGILRTEEKNHDLHTAIDLAVDRMTRQIRRFHDKKIFNRRRKKSQQRAEFEIDATRGVGTPSPDGPEPESMLELEAEISLEELIRRKRFQILPMSEDEAIEQMELLGHDFFVFFNPDDEQINVMYRRRDGHYGVIQPELA